MEENFILIMFDEMNVEEKCSFNESKGKKFDA
jgi:hypothetical protein